jgi:hypothetical protein
MDVYIKLGWVAGLPGGLYIGLMYLNGVDCHSANAVLESQSCFDK